MSKSWQEAVSGEDWATAAFKAAAMVGMPGGSQFVTGVNQFMSGDLSVGSSLADAIANAAKTASGMYQGAMSSMVNSIHNLIDGVLRGDIETPAPPPAPPANRNTPLPPEPSFLGSVPSYVWLGAAAVGVLLYSRRK